MSMPNGPDRSPRRRASGSRHDLPAEHTDGNGEKLEGMLVMKDWIDLSALGQIVLVGLICGAGLPALFAVGLRALYLGATTNPTGPAQSERIVGGSPLGIAAASVCFAVVLAAVGWGIYLIVAGT